MSKRKAPSKSNSKTETDKPPILITLVPHCSGKEEFLKRLTTEGLEEVGPECIPQCFEKVPISTVLSQFGYADSAYCTSEMAATSESYSDRNIYGTPVFSRIASMKDTQQGLLIQLFTTSSSFNDVEVALGASVCDSHRDVFIKAVKKVYADMPVMTSNSIDISIPQAVTYTVQTAKKQLRESARTSDNIIVWSPVGCSAEQYCEALAVSVQSKRAVRYIRWGMEIPVISFEELIRANLVTFLKTGRYVTVEDIFESLNKIEEAMKVDSNGTATHARLSFNAGYSMDYSGMVKKTTATAVFAPCSPGEIYDSKWKVWFAEDIVRAVTGEAEGEAEAGVERGTGTATGTVGGGRVAGGTGIGAGTAGVVVVGGVGGVAAILAAAGASAGGGTMSGVVATAATTTTTTTTTTAPSAATTTTTSTTAATATLLNSAPAPAVDLSSQHNGKTNATTSASNKSEVASKALISAPITVMSSDHNVLSSTAKSNKSNGSNSIKSNGIITAAVATNRGMEEEKEVKSPLVSLLSEPTASHNNRKITDNNKDEALEKNKENSPIHHDNKHEKEHEHHNENEDGSAETTTIQDQKKYCCFSLFGFNL